jgi:hypothetical protein
MLPNEALRGTLQKVWRPLALVLTGDIRLYVGGCGVDSRTVQDKTKTLLHSAARICYWKAKRRVRRGMRTLPLLRSNSLTGSMAYGVYWGADTCCGVCPWFGSCASGLRGPMLIEAGHQTASRSSFRSFSYRSSFLRNRVIPNPRTIEGCFEFIPTNLKPNFPSLLE